MALWERVLKEYDDPLAHKAFLAHCTASKILYMAGHAYRGIIDAAGEDPTARKMLDKVLTQAHLMLTQEEKADRPKSKLPRIISIAIMIILAVGFMILLYYQQKHMRF